MTKSINLLFKSILFLFPVALFAAGGVVKDPTGVAPDRYVYYPGTEALDKDEYRYKTTSLN